MTCPQCNTEMQDGTALVKTSVWWMILGQLASFQHLYFFPKGAEEGEVVLRFLDSRTAFRCPGCQTVVIAGKAESERGVEGNKESRS